ncbi:MAG: flagellar hook-basal body complex protein [Pirellulaceae bacterium]
MASSLYASVSGLLAHQRKLDVVANNLANLNTLGFKSQQINFTDLIYTDISIAAGSTGGRAGGRNPNQIGNGVQVSQVTRNFQQGVLQSTGRSLDIAISGEGFFTVSDGVNRYFTRDGSFSVNSAGYLVTGTGNLVYRTGTLGEPSDSGVGYQQSGDEGIFIPLGNTLPGLLTSEARFTGNLPAAAIPPLAEVLTSLNPYTEGGGTPATIATLLNDLDTSTTPYVGGDTIDITGSDVDGTNFNVTLNVDGTTTLGDIVNALNAQLTMATASIDTNGNLLVRANDVGESALNIRFENGIANTGELDFDATALQETTGGKDGDTVFTTLQIYDERGQAQTLTAEFQKESTDIWNATFSLTTNNGTMVDATVNGIEFNNDGTFKQINGVGTGGPTITIDFDGIGNDQTIDIDFSQLSHTPSDFGTFFDQDGYPTGILTDITVTGKGVLEAIATNGQRVSVAQLAITSFRNAQGLSSEGNNLFSETVASGQAQIGTGLTNDRGEIVGGNLEQSNVDIAFEFTQLIVAQRGFSANARTVTVTDNILQELTNIVR